MSRGNSNTRASDEQSVRSELPPVRLNTIRRRMLVVAVVLAAGMTIATGRAVMLQTVDSAVMKREAAGNYVRSETIDAWRGDIIDRKGGLLAVSVNRWAVTVDPSTIKEPAKVAQALAPIVGKTADQIHERIDPATAVPVHEQTTQHPSIRIARKTATPMVKLLERMWQTPRERLDRRLDVLERFMQLDQLRDRAIFQLVDTLADAAERTAGALHADVNSLRFFPSRGRRFAYVARDLDDQQIRELTREREAWNKRCREARKRNEACRNPLLAVLTRPEPRRYYPKRESGAQLLGLVGRDGKGLSGIERAMDAILAGGQTAVSTIRDNRGRRIYLDGIPDSAALAGSNVQLSIDLQIQAAAEREIAKACLSSGARAGYAVVMRVGTGEVLAAANFPNYNPNTFQTWFADRRPLTAERAALAKRRDDLSWASKWSFNTAAFPDLHADYERESFRSLNEQIDAYVEYQHRFPNASRNTAFLDVYEPGSVMKIFTAAAALEEDAIDLSQVFDLEKGDWELHDADDNVIHDVSKMKRGDLARIIKKSSNIGAAKIAFELGAERLDAYLRRFGFGSQTGSGVPGEARGLLRPAAQWVPVELANVSFGQGMAATGIQIVTALAALGNGGTLMRPLVVRRLVSEDGTVLREFEPEKVRQVVSERTARTVLDLMRGVTEPDGTGRRAYIPGYPVAGKTGTGQKPHLRKRGYSEAMWVNTFVGLAPADNPELAIVILVDEPTGKNHGGGLIAAPAFQKIMRFSLDYLGVPSPYEAGKRQAWLDPDVLARRRAMPTDDNDPLERHGPPVDVARSGDVPVPDFRGMTMDEVRQQATSLGLLVWLQGSGVAVAQTIPAHERVRVGSHVTISFNPRAPGVALDPSMLDNPLDRMPALPEGDHPQGEQRVVLPIHGDAMPGGVHPAQIPQAPNGREGARDGGIR